MPAAWEERGVFAATAGLPALSYTGSAAGGVMSKAVCAGSFTGFSARAVSTLALLWPGGACAWRWSAPRELRLSIAAARAARGRIILAVRWMMDGVFIAPFFWFSSECFRA